MIRNTEKRVHEFDIGSFISIATVNMEKEKEYWIMRRYESFQMHMQEIIKDATRKPQTSQGTAK